MIKLSFKRYELIRLLMKKMCLDENMTDKGMMLSSAELDLIHDTFDYMVGNYDIFFQNEVRE
jgi:hypothetical protein